jgi:formylglycine-generating enzyme required for sulfatase activity
MEFALIPKGKSWLGGGGGKPGNQEVEILNDFYLGKYLVTQEEWQKVMGTNPSTFKSVPGIPREDLKRFPVDSVSWNDCQEYVKRLNAKVKDPGWVYRLPTELEWEYGCRGGPMTDRAESAFDFYFDVPTSKWESGKANVDNIRGRTCKVGSYPPNRVGLYDMHGNVWEWCEDAKVDLRGALHIEKGASQRVERGGCWHDGDTFWRASARISFPPTYRSSDHGLRLARVPVAQGSAPSP